MCVCVWGAVGSEVGLGNPSSLAGLVISSELLQGETGLLFWKEQAWVPSFLWAEAWAFALFDNLSEANSLMLQGRQSQEKLLLASCFETMCVSLW